MDSVIFQIKKKYINTLSVSFSAIKTTFILPKKNNTGDDSLFKYAIALFGKGVLGQSCF